MLTEKYLLVDKGKMFYNGKVKHRQTHVSARW